MLVDPLPPALPATQTAAWSAFTIISFAAAVLMLSIGIVMLPMDLWVRGYFAIGALMLMQSCFTLAKQQRDRAENARMLYRVDAAKAEKRLMDATN